MKVYKNPSRNEWKKLIVRPVLDNNFLRSSMVNIIDRVKKGGDASVNEFTLQFDKVRLTSLQVSQDEIIDSKNKLREDVKSAIKKAASNIRSFHKNQVTKRLDVETMQGVQCWRKAVAIKRVGIYIPGGTAPLFSSVLMMAIPAHIAGCQEVIICTPPDQDGNVHPAILYAASITGISKVYKVGGAQAVAAMAMGTESIPKVDKIFGPGNQYVTAAKQIVSEMGTAIDMPAGPSELAVLADDSANPRFIAADLLSQAEHGVDSQVILVTTSPTLADQVGNEIEGQISDLPRRDIAEKALQNSKIILLENEKEAIDFINEYAPEHLIIQFSDVDRIAEEINNAGSVFLGNYTPESAGDYASGTNHTLPTNGAARAYSGLSTESFVKYITFQKISEEGLKDLGPTIEIMAEAEELEAHKRAVSIRLKEIDA